MNKFTKTCALALSIGLALCISACGGGEGGKGGGGGNSGGLKQVDALPSYEEQTMWIGAWNNPPATEQAYRYLEDGGFNMVFTWNNNPTALSEHLRLGAEHNVKIYAMLGTSKVATPVEEVNENWLDTYSDYEGLGGFSYMDEPGQNAYEGLGLLAENHDKNYSDIDYYVNLYPTSFFAQNSENVGLTYAEYVEKFCESCLSKLYNTRRILSFDHYCMSLGTNGGYLSETWLETVETIARYGKEYDAMTHAFLLTTKHYSYLAQIYESLRFQANVYMAYGVQGLSHFTYSGGFNDYPVDPGTGLPVGDGRLYYDMAQLNSELLAWDDIFLAFDWKEVMHVTGSDNLAESAAYTNPVLSFALDPVDEIDYVEEVTATKDTIVGSFTDENGNIGLMVTNFDFPTAVTGLDDEVADAPDFSTLGTNVVTLTVPGANTAMLVENGELSVVEVTDGKIELALEPAGAAFVIPLNLVN